MRVLILGSSIPYATHAFKGITAVNIVSYYLAVSLADAGHEVFYQPLLDLAIDSQPFENGDYVLQIDRLKDVGIQVLEPVFVENAGKQQPSFRKRMRLLLYRCPVADFYPVYRVRAKIEKAVRSVNAAAILNIWSPEGIAASFGIRHIPKIAYYGDIDFVPNEIYYLEKDVFGSRNNLGLKHSLLDLLNYIKLKKYKNSHLKIIKDYDHIGCVTYTNVAKYRELGVSQATYFKNTWYDVFEALGADCIDWHRKRRNLTKKVKIIGHVGHLRMTGSSIGLDFLLRKAAPLMRAKLPFAHEIHIIGGGELRATLKPFSGAENVVLRGYVDDLEKEFLDADFFFLLNNVGRYNSAFTRHVIAWSAGQCLVVHRNSVKALPEIDPGVNAIVIDNEVDLAEKLIRVVEKPDTYYQIRRSGRHTYLGAFQPQQVAAEVLAIINSHIH